jgi:U3 small nucleolar RNA-associated protein 15
LKFVSPFLEMATEYQKLELKPVAKAVKTVTPEARYWKKFRFPILVSHQRAVTSIHFSPVVPHDYAICSSLNVTIYSASTNSPKFTISKFKDIVNCASFRSDGELIVAGSDDGVLSVFETKERRMLRVFKGHEKAIHVAKFSPDRHHIYSGSDDRTVRYWDLPTETQVLSFTEHRDRVKCGTVSAATPDIWVSGSYDHTVKLWDVRANECIRTLEHGSPVEDVLMYPSGTVLVSSGSTHVKVWDLLGGFKLLETLAAHQKTVTSLALDGTQSRLFSGSLDQMIKIYDTTSYKCTHSIKYSAPILCIGVSPTNSHLIAGLTDGILSIRHRVDVSEEHERTEHRQRQRLGINNWRYYMRGRNAPAREDDIVIERKRKQRLKKYDIFLRKFQYRKALQAALETSHGLTVVSLFEEFLRRRQLHVALSGLNEVTIQPLLRFLIKYINHTNYSQTLIRVANIFLDLYSPVVGESAAVDKLFVQLRRRVLAEIEFQKQLFQLSGVLDLLLTANMFNKESTNDIEQTNTNEIDNESNDDDNSHLNENRIENEI